MAGNSRDISDAQRTKLLRAGVVLLDYDLGARHPWAVVTGAGAERVERVVADELGVAVDVEIAGDVPRRLMPRPCVGHMEREPGRLQLRFVLRGDEHVDDIVQAEDDESVVVYAIVCASVAGMDGQAWEGPWHVYLGQPLATARSSTASPARRCPTRTSLLSCATSGRQTRRRTRTTSTQLRTSDPQACLRRRGLLLDDPDTSGEDLGIEECAHQLVVRAVAQRLGLQP